MLMHTAENIFRAIEYLPMNRIWTNRISMNDLSAMYIFPMIVCWVLFVYLPFFFFFTCSDWQPVFWTLPFGWELWTSWMKRLESQVLQFNQFSRYSCIDFIHLTGTVNIYLYLYVELWLYYYGCIIVFIVYIIWCSSAT